LQTYLQTRKLWVTGPTAE